MATPSKRDLILKEILTTEQTYVKTLQLLSEHAVPIFTKHLSQREVSTLFFNVQSLYTINRDFCTKLEAAFQQREKAAGGKAPLDDPTIAQILLDFAPFFKVYGGYSGNYDFANDLTSTLQTNSTYLKAVKPEMDKIPEFKAMSNLTYYLIQPVQRPSRYVLMLRELLRSSGPKEFVEETKVFTKALALYEELATNINTEIKKSQSRFLVQVKAKEMGLPASDLVQPYRFFIDQQPLSKIIPRVKDKKTNQQQMYEFYLFNDMLIYGTKTKATSSPPTPTTGLNSIVQLCEPHEIIPFDSGVKIVDDVGNDNNTSFYITRSVRVFLDNCEVVAQKDKKKDNNNNDNTKNNTKHLQYHNIASIYINCETAEVKKKWFDLLTNTIQEYVTATATPKASINNSNNYELMMNSLSLPPKEATSCAVCNQEFGVFLHKHSCKLCHEIICDDCGRSYEQIKIIKEGAIASPNNNNRPVSASPSTNTTTAPQYNIRICDVCCLQKPDPTLSLFNKYWKLSADQFLLNKDTYRYLLGLVNVYKCSQNGQLKPYTLLVLNDLILITSPVLSGNNTLNTTKEITTTAITSDPANQKQQQQQQTAQKAAYNTDYNALLEKYTTSNQNDATLKYNIHYMLPINDKLVINNNIPITNTSESQKFFTSTTSAAEVGVGQKMPIFEKNVDNGLFVPKNKFLLHYTTAADGKKHDYGKHEFYFDSFVEAPTGNGNTTDPSVLLLRSAFKTSSHEVVGPTTPTKTAAKKEDKKDKKDNKDKKDDNKDKNKDKQQDKAVREYNEQLKKLRKQDRATFLNYLIALTHFSKTKPTLNVYQFCTKPAVPSDEAAATCTACNKTSYGFFSGPKMCNWCFELQCKSCISTTATIPHTQHTFNICSSCKTYQPTSLAPCRNSGWFWW